MATWPHEETPLTGHEQAAYRYLLYQAMLDIRGLCQSRGSAGANPFEWQRQYHQSRLAGAIADWLHNLAFYAARDFHGFDADWFWVEYDSLSNRVPQFQPDNHLDYRKRYAMYLERLKTGNPW